MMPAWLKTVEGEIHGMREPGEWMPVAGVARSECPGHAGNGHALLDVGIVNDIIRVIIINEIKMPRRPISIWRGRRNCTRTLPFRGHFPAAVSRTTVIVTASMASNSDSAQLAGQKSHAGCRQGKA